MNDATTSPTAQPALPAETPRYPTRDGDAEDVLKLWVVLARAHTAVGKHAEADIARHGMTLAEFAVIEALFHKGPLLLGEVQRKILVSSGGITYLVDRLVEKGLVERRDCPNDRRARYASLTPAGEALMERIFPEHVQSLRRALSGLSAEEQKAAISLLRRLGRHAAEVPSSASPG